MNFTYTYPWSFWNANSRYACGYETAQTTLNGNNTHALKFKTAIPLVSADIVLSAENVSGSSVLNQQWTLYRYTSSWAAVGTFIMPSTGTYTYNYTAGALNILKFAAVPTSQYTSNTTWGNGILVVNAKIREDVTPFDFVTGDYHTAFPNMSGVATRPAQIYANIDGTLKAVKKVYANIDGVLTELTPVYSSSVSTSGPDVMAVYPFTPPVSGTYQIINEQVSGYIEARLYDSAFNQINMSAEYTPSPLVGGQTYYLSLTSNIGDENGANSLVFIYKKD